MLHQKGGEALFGIADDARLLCLLLIVVPSGWYHQVENVVDTISINHNWSNAFTLDLMAAFLQQQYRDVEREIADIKGGLLVHFWLIHVSRYLRNNRGMA